MARILSFLFLFALAAAQNAAAQEGVLHIVLGFPASLGAAAARLIL